MVGDGIEDTAYWLDIGSTGNPGHGDLPGELAGAFMVFAQPVSWEGMVNTASQPCAGKGNEGHVDPDHPCRLVEREFGQEFRSYSDVRVIRAQVFVRQGLVANMFGSSPDPSILQQTIDEISNR